MKHVVKIVSRLRESGQAMTEYIIIVTLVAVMVLAAVKLFGTSIKAGFQRATTAVTSMGVR